VHTWVQGVGKGHYGGGEGGAVLRGCSEGGARTKRHYCRGRGSGSIGLGGDLVTGLQWLGKEQ
jgi:hypothetical protein